MQLKRSFCDFELPTAIVQDVYYLKKHKKAFLSSVLLGDKSYLITEYQLDLFHCKQHQIGNSNES